eukprot:8741365-Pyramimonas_sp.AAC.1
MPGTPDASVKYFCTMLDADGDGRVTYEELRHAIRNCMSAGRPVTRVGTKKGPWGVERILAVTGTGGAVKPSRIECWY